MHSCRVSGEGQERVVWVAHMKTTIDVADPLLRQAKKLAQQRGTTLKAVFEDTLRRELEAANSRPRLGPVRTHTFGGKGLQPGLSWADWDTLRGMAYEGRGG